MLKNLIKIANELDGRKLTREADFLDNLILKISTKKTPTFLSLVPPLEEPSDVRIDESPMDSIMRTGFTPIDVDALEAYRDQQINFYREEMELNRGGPREDLALDAAQSIAKYKNASHDELLAEIEIQDSFDKGFRAVNKMQTLSEDMDNLDQASSRKSREQIYEEHLSKAFDENFSDLVRNYGVDNLSTDIANFRGSSQIDRELRLDDGTVIMVPDLGDPMYEAFDVMQQNEDKLIKAMQGLPLSAVIAYIKSSEWLSDDYDTYEKVMKPAALRNPIELQRILQIVTDNELRPWLEEYLEDVKEVAR